MLARKAIVLILLAFLSVGRVFAQSYLGTIYSPSRSGISYGKVVSDGVFIDVAAGIDYGASVLKQNRQPGVSATFSYNFVILDKEHLSGRSVIYVGPGVSLGYLRDRKKPYGLMAGISGVLGYEYRFSNSLSLGASVVPTFGVHTSTSSAGMMMDIYRNGLLWSFGPQVSVKYSLSPKRPSKSGSKDSSGSGSDLEGGSGRADVVLGGRSDFQSRGENGSTNVDSREETGSVGVDGGYGGFGSDRAGEGSGESARRAWPLFTFGAEWGYSATINHAYHHNYTSPYGRVNLRSNYMCFRSNGYVMVHGGVNCGRHFNLSVYGGYEGIYKGQTVIPLSLRGTVLFGKNPLSSRWLAFLDGGWAFSDTKYSGGSVGKIGGGYRISLTRSVKMDFMLSYQFIYSDIELYDENGEHISDSRVRRNDNYFSSLNLSLSFTF